MSEETRKLRSGITYAAQSQEPKDTNYGGSFGVGTHGCGIESINLSVSARGRGDVAKG